MMLATWNWIYGTKGMNYYSFLKFLLRIKCLIQTASNNGLETHH